MKSIVLEVFQSAENMSEEELANECFTDCDEELEETDDDLYPEDDFIEEDISNEVIEDDLIEGDLPNKDKEENNELGLD